ncbi:MAG: MBL fold metallo-hydrolase, partial [Lachnospiraceae bacterium]|nr:MBL fold metallo-hydrolase [Lachnospiraceae bacterium]
MIIQNLIENTCRRIGLEAEHGLSFYIETDKKKVLFDTGSSDRYARNAQKLGFDLSEVDALILSHGHYDHTGGMKAFMEVNKMADIYIQKDAAGEFFSMREEGPVYIGIP